MEQIELPADLKQKILARIDTRAKRDIKRKAFLSYLLTGFSLLAIVPAAQFALEEFYRSGFYQFFSILLSDGDLLLSLWKELGLSLIDSLPIMGLISILSLASVLAWSTGTAISSSKKLFYYKTI